MKITRIVLKKSLLLLGIGIGLLTSCGEKKDAEAAAKKAQIELKAKEEQAEAVKKKAMEKAEAMKKAEAEAMEKEKMKADSIRQVKEHGHAH